MRFAVTVCSIKESVQRFMWLTVVSIDRLLLKGEAPRFQLILPIPSHVTGRLSVGPILYKIGDVMSEFPFIVLSSGSILFFNPILIFPIPLAHPLESSSNGGINF